MPAKIDNDKNDHISLIITDCIDIVSPYKQSASRYPSKQNDSKLSLLFYAIRYNVREGQFKATRFNAKNVFR